MHDLIVPARYLAPKWQAYVTPSDSAFVFADGTKVKSLWGLKQALLKLPEDVISHHLREDANDIAAWVGSVVGDKALSEELSKYRYRWGLIVALERQLMRTLNLPSYVAKRWLAEVKLSFKFQSGEEVKSLSQLAEVLTEISEETFAFHLERDPNDISVWVTDVIGDYELGQLLNEAESKSQMHRFVSDHVAMLEEATQA